MNLRLPRCLVVLLIAIFAFGQACAAQADCHTDGSGMAQAMTMSADEACGDCPTSESDSVGATCVTHCTGNSLVASAEYAFIAPSSSSSAPASKFDVKHAPKALRAPPDAPPRRILLHSFQI